MPIVKRNKQRDKTRKDGRAAQWSNKQKYKAVAAYLICGNMSVVAAETKIPLDTLYRWKVQSWWREQEEEIRASYVIQHQNKLKKLTEKVLEKLDDRVEHGDYFFNQKKGRMERVPVNAKNLNIIAKDSIDRELLLEKVRKEAPQAVQERDINLKLASLAESFKALAKRVPSETKTKHKGEIIDVTEIKTETPRFLGQTEGEVGSIEEEDYRVTETSSNG